MRDKVESSVPSDVTRDYCQLYLLLNAASAVALSGGLFGFVWLPSLGGMWVLAGIAAFFLGGICWAKITVRFLNLGIEMRLMGIEWSITNLLLRACGLRQGKSYDKTDDYKASNEAA